MYLHEENRDLFRDLISLVAEMSGIRTDIIEKDYYVVMLLQELAKIDYPVVFKGGTSLSKAYGVIDRFSEDIDITFTEHIGASRRKKLKYNVMKPISEKLGLEIVNWNSIESNKNLNHYDFSYDTVVDEADGSVPPYVKIETSLMSYSFPTNECTISNYYYKYLHETQHDLLDKYLLLPFKMKVQSLERTLIDKMFAVCDYYLLGKSRKNARHLYDINKLLNHVEINQDFLNLVKDVRTHRLTLGNNIAPAADFSVDMRKTAHEIKNSDFFRKDYNDTTVFMISEKLEYEEVIRSYTDLIDRIWG